MNTKNNELADELDEAVQVLQSINSWLTELAAESAKDTTSQKTARRPPLECNDSYDNTWWIHAYYDKLYETPPNLSSTATAVCHTTTSSAKKALPPLSIT